MKVSINFDSFDSGLIALTGDNGKGKTNADRELPSISEDAYARTNCRNSSGFGTVSARLFTVTVTRGAWSNSTG